MLEEGEGTPNFNTKGIEFKTLRKKEFRILRRGRNAESREKGSGTWNHENKGMEFETLRVKEGSEHSYHKGMELRKLRTR